jgi:hypothetical protein
MKLNRSMLAAVAMILSAATALGCNTNKKSTDEEAFVAAPPAAEAPVAETPSVGTEDHAKVTAKVQIPAPPALRVESPGRAPSAKHRYSAGFWRYDTGRRGYVWVPGHWELRDGYAPYAPPAPRYESRLYSPGRDYVFVSGYWSWTGREYSWIPGHYESRRSGYRYVAPRWEQDGGRWVKRDGYWAQRPAGERGKHRPGTQASSNPHGGQTGNHQAGNHGGQTGNHQAGNHGGQTGNHQAAAPAPQAQAPAATPKVAELAKPAIVRARPELSPSKAKVVEVQKPVITETKPSLTPPKPSKLVVPSKARPTAPPKAEGPKSRLPAAGRAG